MNIKKRIDFFAKISGRNSHANPGRIGGASDTHAMNIPCGDADATHKQRMETPIYATDRLQKNIQVSANSPAEATDVNLSARVAKAIQAKMKGQSVPGESRWFLEEIGQYIPTGCVYLVGGSDFKIFRNRYRASTGESIYQYYKDGDWVNLPANTGVDVVNGLLCIRAKTSSISGFEGNFTDVIGDSRYLVDYTAPQDVIHVGAHQFHEPATTSPKFDGRGLFEGCTSLVSISKDFLPCDLFWQTSSDDDPNPSANYAAYAYAGMFEGCSALKNTPDLPAFRVAPYCYYKMFAGCTSLEVAPALPAEATAAYGMTGCYKEMFNGCTSLKACPALPAPILDTSSYESMFQGCTSITSSPVFVAPSNGIQSTCYKNMFSGCTSLVNVGKISNYAAPVAANCFYGMFQGCTSLETLPEFARTTTMGSSHKNMFRGCVKLKNIPEGFELSASGEASANSFEGFFQGCTSLTDTDLAHVSLPNATLKTACYKDMFKGCTGITTIPETFLPSNPTIAKQCFDGMFRECTNLIKAPTTLLPATTLKEGCYKNMFSGCSKLTQAPYLPATTPAVDCYMQMFLKCSSLENIYCNLTSLQAQSDDAENAQAYVTHKWVADSETGSISWGVAPRGTLYINTTSGGENMWKDATAAASWAGLPYLGEQETQKEWSFGTYPTE